MSEHITIEIAKTIKVGDILILRLIDNENAEPFKEIVTSIKNPKVLDDIYFSIRTENYDYDFQNFFDILKVIKPKESTLNRK